jgi:hypothetical protein
MSYYDLYQKYKNKYLKLKNQLGGAGLNLFLPCDIHNITEKFMIKVDDVDKYYTNISNIYEKTNTEYRGTIFIQDPLIIFNKNDLKYIIQIASNIYNLPGPNEINDSFKSDNELLFGGNFISTPPNPLNNNLSIIITTKCLDKNNNDELDRLIHFINLNLDSTQKIINIFCSFPHLSGSIHIDELLCPMPYKENYKIWIYKITSITINDIKKPSDRLLSDKLKQYIDEKKDLNLLIQLFQEEYIKFIQKLKELDDNKKMKITEKIREKSKIENESLVFDIKISDIKKKENLLYLNYLLNNNGLKDLYDKLDNKETLRRELIDKFNVELEENKRIIGLAIFGESYEKNRDEINKNFFVEYPIDLNLVGVNLKGFYGFNMVLPPIFNRVFIKLEETNICFIPVKNAADKFLLDFMAEEQKLMIENIKFEYVDTYKYHIEGDTGGNIHCLSKQIFRN